MRKYFLLFLFLLPIISCDKKSKIEKEVEEIPVQMKLVRFEKAFFETAAQDLQKVKAEFPEFFQEGVPDQVWIDKMQNPDWRALYQEVKNKYGDFSAKQTEIEEVFKRIKYFFPTIKTPSIYTLIGEMDYNNKVIYAKDKLLISLELFLGKDHKFYDPFPQYIRQNFEERQIMPEVASSFALGVISSPKDATFISQMIYYGKELYLKDVLLDETYTDAEKIGYTPEHITWSQDNEMYIWTYFIENQLLYSTNSKLSKQFIDLAPFSKFYLELDNESPGRIGQWVGWQIVRSFMENNPKVTVKDLVKMDAKTIFEQSKYKPKRNE